MKPFPYVLPASSTAPPLIYGAPWYEIDLALWDTYALYVFYNTRAGYEGGLPVRVGRTKRLFARIEEHQAKVRDYQFDKVFVMFPPPGAIGRQEWALITHLRPIYNKTKDRGYLSDIDVRTLRLMGIYADSGAVLRPWS